MLGRKIRDSAPDTKPVSCSQLAINPELHLDIFCQAGKVWVKGHGTKECMDFTPPSGERNRTPDGVRRMRGVFRPEPGQSWDSYHRTGDPPIDPNLSHGVKTVSSLKVNPVDKVSILSIPSHGTESGTDMASGWASIRK